MRLASKLRKFVEMGDFFYSSQMLRFRGEDEYRTFTGGIVSIGIIITIIIGFSNMILNTLNLNTINFTQNVLKKESPSPTTFTASPLSDFMFGIEIWGLNLSSSIRYFNIDFIYRYEEAGQATDTYLSLVACTKEHWSLMPGVVKNFEKLSMGGWLCPPIGFSFDLMGKYSSDIYKQIGFQVRPCTNESDPTRPCASKQQIDQLFQDNGDWFYFTFYFTNTVINPDQTDYKTYFLEDENFVIFGSKMGVESYVYFTDYTINTDYSILPFGEIIVDNGFMVEDLNMKNQYMSGQSDAYVLFYLAKSSKSIVFERQVQKISTVFSFMGGLIGALMAIMFIVNSYTSFSYEISVALDVFGKSPQLNKKSLKDLVNHIEEPEKQIKKAINILDFLKYHFFSLVNFFSKKKPNWPDVEHIYDCRKQILHQLDIKSIIKRLVFLEYSLTYLFQDYQLEGMQIKKPTTPQQIKEIRQKMQMVTGIQNEDINSLIQSRKDKQKIHSRRQEFDDQIVSPSSITEKPPIAQIMKSTCQKSILMKKASGLKVKHTSSIKFSNQNEVILQLDNRKKDLIQQRQNNLNSLKEAALKGKLVSRKIWESLLEIDEPESIIQKDIPRKEVPVEWIDQF